VIGYTNIFMVSDLRDLVVHVPEGLDRMWVEATTTLEGPGSITVYANGEAVSRTQWVGSTAERVTDSVWLTVTPGSQLTLRMEIDGVWSASPEWPTKLSIALAPESEPGQAEVWDLLRSTLYDDEEST